MKTIEKINNYPVLVFILMIKNMIELIAYILPSKTALLTLNQTHSFDWWDFVINLVISTMLWVVLRSYFKLKRQLQEKMITFSIVSFVRNRLLFIKLYENIEFFKLPDMTNDEYWNTLPQGGKLYQQLEIEYNEVYKTLLSNLKNKTVREIDALLKEHYPANLIDKIHKKGR